MSTLVFLAVMAAALLHAAWNALVKGSEDPYLGMTALLLGNMPVAALALVWAPAPDAASWPYIGAATLIHVVYQLSLTLSYRVGELTQVYPIARGSAPIVVAVVSVVFLGVELSGLELLAVLAIAGGILSLGLVRHADGRRNARAGLLALLTGCLIAAYSLVDGLGARAAGTALGYYSWLVLVNGVIFVTLMALSRPGLLARLPRQGKGVFFIGGSTSFIAYAMVIWAFTQAPIALVAALRETSIVFALLLGVVFLKERLDLVKVLATLLTLFGAALVRLARL